MHDPEATWRVKSLCAPLDISLKFDNMRPMDATVIKSFLGERLDTKRAVEGAAAAIDVSVATMYRYKAQPESIGLGQLIKLSEFLGLPLTNGAAWSKASLLDSERRRLELERSIAGEYRRLDAELKVAADAHGRRFQTVPAYTVNSELPEVTRLVLEADYGTRAATLEKDVLAVRAERARLYEHYESWEIWNGYGYLDFFQGKNRYKTLPDDLRSAQVDVFAESTIHPLRHRFVYWRHSPDLPMFGCFAPVGVALVRVEDIHLEYQDPRLVESFEDTFNDLRALCATATAAEFVAFLRNPEPPE